MSQRYGASLAAAAEREEIRALTARFAESEGRFNAAYASFQRTLEDMRSTQERVALLEKIGTVTALLGYAIQAGAVRTERGGAVQSAGVPEEGWEAGRDAANARLDALEWERMQAQPAIKLRAGELQQQDTQLRQTYQRGGVDVPARDGPLVLPRLP